MDSYSAISKHRGIFKVYLDDESFIAHFKKDTLSENDLSETERENSHLNLIVIEDVRLYSESDMKEGFSIKPMKVKDIRKTEILRVNS